MSRVDPKLLAEANDPLLAPLIGAVDENDRRHALEEVMTREVQPTIEMVLRRFRADRSIRREDPDDVAAIVTLRVLRRLQNITLDVAEGIASLADYTATLTYNTIYDVLRSRYPERTRLRNRIRHVLAGDARFASWDTPAGMVCGFANMRGSAAAPAVVRFDATADKPLGEIVEMLFRDTGQPIAIGDLVRAIAELLGITDSVARPDVEQRQEPEQLTKLEQKQRLENLWREIRELSREHRIALLLNLREAGGGNAVALFIGLGIATIDEVADAIGLTVERLAELWSSLPLDDLAIAEILGVTRQQVINYRRSARDRLVRRTSGQ